jgi:hypothetical protein
VLWDAASETEAAPLAEPALSPGRMWLRDPAPELVDALDEVGDTPPEDVDFLRYHQ